MARRSHKKSRVGCTECKRRHVKCDEGRPRCHLCILSDRECSFASHPAPARSHALPESSPASTSPGTPGYCSDGRNSVGSSSKHTLDPSLDADVNLNHMELLIQFSLDTELHELPPEILNRIRSTGLRMGLEQPFLLYEMLAFSARRLAFLRPEAAPFYLNQAFALQTRAVSIFNTTSASWGGDFTAMSETHCTAILGFSALLGRHLLTDALAKRDPDGLDGFLPRFTQCAHMHKVVHTVAVTGWPLLMRTALEPVVSWSAGLTRASPRGDHCARLCAQLAAAADLGEDEKEACQLAAKYLQIGFDVILTPEEEPHNRYHLIFTWPLMVSQTFTELLVAKRPEALVVLAYYALLLHYGRHKWLVGDAGVYVIGIIGDFLGPKWSQWLEWPRQRIAEDVA